MSLNIAPYIKDFSSDAEIISYTIIFTIYVENLHFTYWQNHGYLIQCAMKGVIDVAKAILKSLSAENFASFAEQVVFTTEIDPSRKEYLNNTFEIEGSRFNKVSFIYGANGSGKTFFCKILREIQRLLIFSPLTATGNTEFLSLPQFKGLDAPVRPFAFGSEYQNRPTFFGIDVVIDNITYHYEFGVQGKSVISELLTKKFRRTEKLIERTSPAYKDITLRSELKEFESAKHRVKEEALCLPVAALLNNELASKIVATIKDIQVISMAAARIAPANAKESFSEDRLQRYLAILQKADPTLRKINVSLEEQDVGRQKVDVDDFENREIIAMKTVVGIDTVHAVEENGESTSGMPISFFADESLGTVKLFTALPYLFNVLESGGILVVDELENGLHLSLAKEIVTLFTNELSNPHNAQLICTSHQPLLLDGDYRRDQVWVAHKDSQGKCRLQRMSELKTSRAKINLSNRIIEGALGCNPDLFFNNNT